MSAEEVENNRESRGFRHLMQRHAHENLTFERMRTILARDTERGDENVPQESFQLYSLPPKRLTLGEEGIQCKLT